MARNIEAYGVITIWRSTELLRSAINLLNMRQVLVPAILGRSLLELASSIIVNSNNISKTVKDMMIIVDKMKSKSEDGIIISEDLERLVVKMIHGTRIGEPVDYLKQKNMLSYLQSVSQNPNASELMPVYEYLCDMADPNVIGNARFWGAWNQPTQMDLKL